MFLSQQEEISPVTSTNKHYSLIDSVLSMCSIVCNDEFSLSKTSILNLIGIIGDADDILPLLSIGIIVFCVLKSYTWCSSPLFYFNNHSTTADTRPDHSGQSAQSPPTAPAGVPHQKEDKPNESAISQRMRNDQVFQLSRDNNNNCNSCGGTATNTIEITITDLKNVFEQLFNSFIHLSIIICIINDIYGSDDLRNGSSCITNINEYIFGIIISILCIYLIKNFSPLLSLFFSSPSLQILLNCFQTFQIIFKLINISNVA